MSPLELDQLVREIGDEVQRRLGSAPGASACACGTPAPRLHTNGHGAAMAAGDPVAGLINQALLRPDASAGEVTRLCREARHYGFASVCVPPNWVALAVRELRGTNVRVGAVIGYPHGATLTPVKRAEAEQVLKLGARELELAIHAGALNSGDLDIVYTEIRLLAECAHEAGAALKVLAEMALLGEDQKVIACALARLGGADLVKTSADLGGVAAGADVALAQRIVGGELGIEAAGGIDSHARFLEMVAAGATRVGTCDGA
ncbi:MAG: deoxyribose-phosphate aldolase, partial [Bryobacterales bacterium]